MIPPRPPDPTATPYGSLSANPSTIVVGDTTSVRPSNVVPPGLPVKVEAETGHPLKKGSSCSSGSSAEEGASRAAIVAPTPVTFIGCDPGGNATVKLMAASDNFQLASVNVTVVTPTPTPSQPQPTATPTCTLNRLGTLSHFKSVPHRSYNWTDNCKSSGSPSVLARFIEFILSEESHVTIDILSSTVDTYLILTDSEGKIKALDDNGYPDNDGTDSRIVRVLPEGTYEIEATRNDVNKTGFFTLYMQIEEPIPHRGHQADYTVQYEIGSIPTWTPVPTLTPTSSSESTSSSYKPVSTPRPGFAIIFRAAIYFAKQAWNTAVATSWPHVLFCEKGDSECDDANTDKNTVPINVVSGETNGEGNTGEPDGNINNDCGWTVACIKFVSSFFSRDDKYHLEDLKGIVIEEPAWAYIFDNKKTPLINESEHIKYIWTNIHPGTTRGTKPTGRTTNKGWKVHLKYLPGTIMHELGHAAGLIDIRGIHFDYYLMGSLRPIAVPQNDIDYLKQVYRNDHGSEPHK